jgi:hypothetical protein
MNRSYENSNDMKLDQQKPEPGWILTANSLLVIGICSLLMYPLALCIFAMRNPFAMGGALGLLPAVCAVGLLQYYSIFRRREDCAYVVAIMYLISAAFILFSLIVTIAEGMRDDMPNIRLIIWFSGISLGLLVYVVFLALMNIKWGRLLKKSIEHTKDIVPYRMGSRKSLGILIGLLSFLFIAGVVHGLLSKRNPIRYAENVDSVTWLPKTARNVSYYISYMYTAYEFDIPEKEFLKWAKKSYWNVSRIKAEPVSISRYNWPILREFDYHKEFVTRESETSVTIEKGYVYKKRFGRSGGGLIVAYDSDINRAYYQHNPR